MAPFKKQKYVSKAKKYSAGSLIRKGCKIIEKSKLLELTKQVRCVDLKHMELLEIIGQGNQLTLDSFKQYDPLTAEDVNDIKTGLYKAPIIVTTNRERLNLIDQQCRRFAAVHGTHVVRFFTGYSNGKGKPLRPDQVNQALDDPCFWQYFVRGAEGFVCVNINKSMGIVNGTRVRYCSILANTKEEQEELKMRLATTPLGNVISLQWQPKAFCVELMDVENVQQWDEITMEQSKVVIPMIKMAAESEPPVFVPGGVDFLPSQVTISKYFPLEIAFAITVHKAQSRTMDKVILALSERGQSRCEITYAHLFVALSRVKSGADLRLLIHKKSGTNGQYDWEALEYLTTLVPDSSINALYAGFLRDRIQWNAKAALQAYEGK